MKSRPKNINHYLSNRFKSFSPERVDELCLNRYSRESIIEGMADVTICIASKYFTGPRDQNDELVSVAMCALVCFVDKIFKDKIKGPKYYSKICLDIHQKIDTFLRTDQVVSCPVRQIYRNINNIPAVYNLEDFDVEDKKTGKEDTRHILFDIIKNSKMNRDEKRIFLCKMRGYSAVEISETLNISLSSVGVIFFRALKKARKRK